MGLNASKIKGTSNFVQQEPLEAGAYPARLVQVIGLGLHPQTKFNHFKEDSDPPRSYIMLTYEFVDEFMLDKDGEEISDKPRWFSETIPLLSLESEKANSTKRYFALDPSNEFGGDFSQLVGKPVMVNLVQNQGKGKNAGKIYENIKGVSPVREKDSKRMPELVNAPKIFDPSNPDMKILGSLPDWVQQNIKSALDWGQDVDSVIPDDKQEGVEDSDQTEDEGEW